MPLCLDKIFVQEFRSLNYGEEFSVFTFLKMTWVRQLLLKCWLGTGAGTENLHFPLPNLSKDAAVKNLTKHQLSCTCGDFTASWAPLYQNSTALHHPSSVEKSCSRCFFPSFVWFFQRSTSLNSHLHRGIVSTPSSPILGCITTPKHHKSLNYS